MRVAPEPQSWICGFRMGPLAFMRRGEERFCASAKKQSATMVLVEPTGSFMDDPNVTDRKFPGNPTRSYRSREPLRVVSEHLDWVGHSPAEIQVMKEAIAGKEPIDD